MDEYIEREVAIKKLDHFQSHLHTVEGTSAIGVAKTLIKEIPAANVRPNMNGCEFCGYANRTAGKTLHIVEEIEPRIFINMQGSGYIQIFDEDYPGFVDGFYVNYCPMCGARLRSGYVGGDPPKEEE